MTETIHTNHPLHAELSSSSSEDESENDENTDCDVADCAFESPPTEEIDDNGMTYSENLVDDQKEFSILGDDWAWNQWEELDIDDTIDGPEEEDHYNGPHGLKEGVAKKFQTVLHCLLKTIAMDEHFFARLVTQTNKIARRRMAD